MRFSRRQPTAAVVGILAIICSITAWAQSGEDAAIAHALDAFKGALLSGDGAPLEAVLAPELSYGHSNGQTQTRQEFIDTVVSRTLVPKYIELSDRRVIVVGDDAIVRYNFTAEAVQAGKTIPIRIGVMEVWQRRGGNWAMFAHQAYPRVASN